MLPTKLLYRTAHRICSPRKREEPGASGPEQPFIRRVAEEFRAFQGAGDRLAKARGHGLSLIVPTLQDNLCEHAKHLRRALEALQHHLETPAPRAPSVLSVAADLRQLEKEFDSVQVHRGQKAISVTTEPITLHDVELGPFVVKLHWERSWREWGSACFEIIAVEPNPAAGNDEVTHPHVKDQVLCAGRAATALRKALEEKRLADAFCLVRSVLKTYNPDSPHVALSGWGTRHECHDCGVSVSADDAWVCDKCAEYLCPECIAQCKSCHASRCHGCIGQCVVCKEKVCERCLRKSAHSARLCCCRCLAPCPRCSRLVARDEIDNPDGCRARQPNINPPIPERENTNESNEPASPGVS